MNIQLFDYSVDLLQALIWQYEDAEVIQSLFNSKQTWYTTNQQQFWTDWYNNVFNLVTANDFGLAVWSIILDVPIYINAAPIEDQAIFGFNAYNPSFPTLLNTNLNFQNGNFSAQGTAIFLSEEEQRLLLRLRYYQLVSRGAIPEINTFLNRLFQTSGEPFSGQAWVLDDFDMTMTYVFNFYLPRIMREVLVQLDLLPRPAAVGLKYIVNVGTAFGFNAYNPSFPNLLNNNQNFENGNFLNEFFA